LPPKKQPQAQRMLYEMFSSQNVWVFCLGTPGSKDDAQDILHDGFLKILKKIEQFEAEVLLKDGFVKLWSIQHLKKYRRQYRMVDWRDDNREADEQNQDEWLIILR
jgi:RNA polymerase sigma-70 factor (ECF subfamily)